MSESGTPAALRCTAPCLPQLTKLREERKSCDRAGCRNNRQTRSISNCVNRAVKPASYAVEFESAQWSVTERGSVSSFPLRSTTLTVSVVYPIGKNARIQAAKIDLTSRWLQPCCFHHATIATTCAVTDLRQAQADSSRQMTAWRQRLNFQLVLSRFEKLT